MILEIRDRRGALTLSSACLRMNTIQLITLIDAPVETCFRLSLSIDLELKAAEAHCIRAVSGVTSGVIGAGQRVGWKTKQFGITVSHVSEITGFQPPLFFQDSMVQGMFKSFQHDHCFKPMGTNKTEMRDLLRFSVPFWLMGILSERLIMRPRLVHLLLQRNRLIKETAEETVLVRKLSAARLRRYSPAKQSARRG
jgi:ligand-binding SRPBCC domain-containing protein